MRQIIDTAKRVIPSEARDLAKTGWRWVKPRVASVIAHAIGRSLAVFAARDDRHAS